MSGIRHLPAAVRRIQALNAVWDLDWPGACPLPAGSEAELTWVPFAFPDRRCLADPEAHPRLASLALAGKASTRNSRSGLPPDRDGQWVVAADGSKVLYAPFWLVTPGDGETDYALVDGTTGEVVRGVLPAAVRPARIRLGVLIGLSVLAIILAGMSVLKMGQVPTLLGLRLGIELRLISALLTLGAAGLAWWAWFALPVLFAEPARRASTGRVAIPDSGDGRRVLRACALAFFVLLVMHGVETGLLLANLFTGFLPNLDYSYWSFLAQVLDTGLVYLLYRYAHRIGRRSASGQAPPRSAEGPTFDLARTCLHVAILAVVGALVGSLFALGFRDLVQKAGWGMSTLPVFLLRGAQLGAFVALHLSNTPAWARGSLSVGMLAHAMGHHVLDPWLGVVLVLGAVFLSDLLMGWRSRGGSPYVIAWRAAGSAWRFALGVVAGGFAGRALGMLTFVASGWSGLAVSEVICALVGGTAGYLSRPHPEGSLEDVLGEWTARMAGTWWKAAMAAVVLPLVGALAWAGISMEAGEELRMPMLFVGVLCGAGVGLCSGPGYRWLSRGLAVVSCLLAFWICKVALLAHYVEPLIFDHYGPDIFEGISLSQWEPWAATLDNLRWLTDGTDLLWLGLALITAVHLAGRRPAQAVRSTAARSVVRPERPAQAAGLEIRV